MSLSPLSDVVFTERTYLHAQQQHRKKFSILVVQQKGRTRTGFKEALASESVAMGNCIHPALNQLICCYCENNDRSGFSQKLRLLFC